MKLKQKVGPAAQQLQKHHWELNGDREALGRLFESLMPRLYRAALRITGTLQDAEEALQDGFLCALRNLGGFESRSRFSTWVTRIVINSALMQLRKNRREVLTSFDPNPESNDMAPAVPLVDPRPNPEEICVWKERFQIFDRSVRSLPESYQSILWLRDVEGMSTREAAEALGLKSSTAKSQLHRARMKLGLAGSNANLDGSFSVAPGDVPDAPGAHFTPKSIVAVARKAA